MRMNDTIETLDDLHGAMITRYPALADRDRHAAIYAKMALQWVWFDTLHREQDRVAVMVQWVRLDEWELDEANTLCAIDVKHARYIEIEKAKYQRRFADLSEDMHRELRDMTEVAHHEIAEATRDLLIERAEMPEMSGE